MPDVTITTRTAERLVTELFAVIDGRRWDDLVTVFAEDGVYLRPGYPALTGLEAIERFYRHERIIAAGEHRVEHVVGDLGVAACWGRFTGFSKSGEPLEEDFADTYRVRDGRIVHRRTFFYRPAI
jgi:ketosteroid isomerase-like protein